MWSGPGSPLSELLEFGDALKASGITPAVTLYGNDSAAAALQNAGFTVFLRPWLPDCPTQSLPPVDSARARVDAALYAIGDTPYTCLSLTNECVWRDVNYAATWIKEAISYSAARGVKCLVPVVWNPGAPALEDVGLLAAAYADAEIAVGWGQNLYPTDVDRMLSDRGGINEYTVHRLNLYRHLLPDSVLLIVTESARGDGSLPPDFSDIAEFARQVDGVYDAVTFWYVGPCGSGFGNWVQANMCGKLDQLADAING